MPVGCIYSYSHWSLLNHNLYLWAASDLCNSIYFVVTRRILTILVDCHIGIFRRNSLSIIFNILKTPRSQASIAPFIFIRICCRAINKLLFTQTNRKWLAFVLNLIGLMSSSGCKSPAWSTLSLIFNCSNNIPLSPINAIWEASIDFLRYSQRFKWSSFSQISIDKFLFCKISKLVNTHFPSVWGVGIMSFNKSYLFFVNFHPILEFCVWRDIFAKLLKIWNIFEP